MSLIYTVIVYAIEVRRPEDETKCQIPYWEIAAVRSGDIVPKDTHYEVKTLRGMERADFGDMIVMSPRGDLYPVKRVVFEAMYRGASNDTHTVPNDDEVICPHCTNQFRAIPVNVQKLMLAAGIEPPFVAREKMPGDEDEIS